MNRSWSSPHLTCTLLPTGISPPVLSWLYKNQTSYDLSQSTWWLGFASMSQNDRFDIFKLSGNLRQCHLEEDCHSKFRHRMIPRSIPQKLYLVLLHGKTWNTCKWRSGVSKRRCDHQKLIFIKFQLPSIFVFGDNGFTRMDNGKVTLFSLKRRW